MTKVDPKKIRAFMRGQDRWSGRDIGGDKDIKQSSDAAVARNAAKHAAANEAAAEGLRALIAKAASAVRSRNRSAYDSLRSKFKSGSATMPSKMLVDLKFPEWD